MGAAENKQLLQHVFSELSNGNPGPFVESVADDVRWNIIGTTPWSKTFEGKQAVLTDLLGPLNTNFDVPIQVTAHRFIAEDDFVVVEGRGQATTKSGKPYNNTYCWVYRFADGKVIEVTEYMDTQLAATSLEKPY
jgi:ketosteroid isomerase-like protein